MSKISQVKSFRQVTALFFYQPDLMCYSDVDFIIASLLRDVFDDTLRQSNANNRNWARNHVVFDVYRSREWLCKIDICNILPESFLQQSSLQPLSAKLINYVHCIVIKNVKIWFFFFLLGNLNEAYMILRLALIGCL